jgi:uncharacterized protein YkwD
MRVVVSNVIGNGMSTRLPCTLALAAMCAAFLVAPSVLAARPTAGEPTLGTKASGTSPKRALAEINAARHAHGLRSLRLDARLARAAAAHARSMGQRGYFSHSSAEGSSAAERIRRYYPGAAVGEVIFWREPTATARQAIEAWLSSASHRRIVLGRAFRHVGISAVHMTHAPGVYGGRDVTIIVADFGAP